MNTYAYIYIHVYMHIISDCSLRCKRLFGQVPGDVSLEGSDSVGSFKQGLRLDRNVLLSVSRPVLPRALCTRQTTQN